MLGAAGLRRRVASRLPDRDRRNSAVFPGRALRSWRDTVVGSHSKLDNLVQVGHNVRVGVGCLLCAQVASGLRCARAPNPAHAANRWRPVRRRRLQPSRWAIAAALLYVRTGTSASRLRLPLNQLPLTQLPLTHQRPAVCFRPCQAVACRRPPRCFPTRLPAQALGGSSTIGDFCVLGGKAAVADHVILAHGTRVAACAGVTSNVATEGVCVRAKRGTERTRVPTTRRGPG